MSTENDRDEPLLDEVRDALAGAGASPERLAAMRAHVGNAPVRGATTFRDGRAPTRVWAGGAVLAIAAILVAVLFLPAVDRRTTVSAAEILGRSRAALSQGATGAEVLTYDLSVGGVLADLVPVEQSGRFTVVETTDHDRPGRYRLLKIAADGAVVAGIADDPTRGTRTRYLRAHGRGYLLRFTGANAPAVSPLAVKRMVLQALITLMQTDANPALRDITCDGEPCYEITVPRPDAIPGALVSLSSGRAIITAADARLVEFAVAGTVAERSFDLAFTLRQRQLRPSSGMSAADFELAPRPGDVVLEGNASANPMWDVIDRALAAIPAPPSR